jgi:hypothetical protein
MQTSKVIQRFNYYSIYEKLVAFFLNENIGMDTNWMWSSAPWYKTALNMSIWFEEIQGHVKEIRKQSIADDPRYQCK